MRNRQMYITMKNNFEECVEDSLKEREHEASVNPLSSTNLLACPFCGNLDNLNYNCHRVMCYECQCQGPGISKPGVEEAIRRWNTREQTTGMLDLRRKVDRWLLLAE